jgi:hypothetical protein
MTSNSASAHFDKMSHLLVLGMPFAFADGRIVTGANLASAKVRAVEAVKVFEQIVAYDHRREAALVSEIQQLFLLLLRSL